MDETRVVVAGAGLAGLVAARHLAQGGADVTVIEERPTVGGRVRTRTEDGFTLDRGFQVLFTSYPAVERELDLAALDLRAFEPGARIVRPGERSTLSDPFRDVTSFTESLFNREVTLSDKLRTLALRQHVTGLDEERIFEGPDTSTRECLRDWGFSEKYVENFVAPFYGGITLDRTLSTSKHVFEYVFKMLSEGEAAIPAEGMAAIPEQLAARARDAGATIDTGEAVESIDDDGVTVVTDERRVDADVAVVATDPRTARSLTDVASIPVEARGCVTQHYSLPRSVSLDAGRMLIVNAADGWPNTVAPVSNVAPEYAPDDMHLLSATFVDHKAQNVSEDELFEVARNALASWYPARSFDALDLVHTDRIEFAQFTQPPGIHEGLPDARDAGEGIYLAGDYTRWSSIQGAMESGRTAAEAVIADR